MLCGNNFLQSIFNGENIMQIVSSIILVEGKLVCLDHKKVGKITIPMGKIDEGEEPFEAITRELSEELGIKVEKTRIIMTAVLPMFFMKKSNLVINNLFKITKYSGEITNVEPEKHLGLYYLTYEELVELKNQGKLERFLSLLIEKNLIFKNN
jgi:8-oxo-dGTP pyrophosphatase MutT (NUDIX family)